MLKANARQRKSVLNNQQGFTLIEIIAVLIILGILAAVAAPKYMDMQEEAKGAAVKGALGAAASNVSLSYAKYIMNYYSAPDTILDNAWEDTDGNYSIPIETDLGDFDVLTYSYEVTDEVGTVTITLDNSSPEWMDNLPTEVSLTKTIDSF